MSHHEDKSTPPLVVMPTPDGDFLVKGQPHPGMRGFTMDVARFAKRGDAETFVTAVNSHAALLECVNLLRWLDGRGGLGLEAHGYIRAALSKLENSNG